MDRPAAERLLGLLKRVHKSALNEAKSADFDTRILGELRLAFVGDFISVLEAMEEKRR